MLHCYVAKTILLEKKSNIFETFCFLSDITTGSQKRLQIHSLHPHQLTKKSKTTTQNNTPLGSRNMVTGVETIPRTTKSTSTNAQQEQNRSKEDSQIQFELETRRDYESKS